MSTTNATDDQGPLQVALPGGTLRMEYGRADTISNPQFDDTLRQGVDSGGAMRLHADGRVEQFGGITRATHGAPADTGNPLDSVLTPWGSSARVITGDCTMNFDGERVPVQTALSFGWLRRAGSDYVVTGRHVAELAQLRATK